MMLAETFSRTRNLYQHLIAEAFSIDFRYGRHWTGVCGFLVNLDMVDVHHHSIT